MSHQARSSSSSSSQDADYVLDRPLHDEYDDVEIGDSSQASAPSEDSSLGDLGANPGGSMERRNSSSSFSSGIEEVAEEEEDDVHEIYLNNPVDEQGIPNAVIRPVRSAIGPRRRSPRSTEARPSFGTATCTGVQYTVHQGTKLLRPQTSKEACKIVVDYLISEGYKEVAEILCREAGIDIPVAELRHLDGRVAIREAIMSGNMSECIRLVRLLCPGLMESHSEVRFHLHQQNMIEMIRNQQVDEVLVYAEEHISNDEGLTPEQLDRLEKTFALLAFDDPIDSPFCNLLSNEHRQQTSTEVNSAVLSYQNRPSAPRLEALLRMIVWGQKQLIEKDSGRNSHFDSSQISNLVFGSGISYRDMDMEGDGSDMGTSI